MSVAGWKNFSQQKTLGISVPISVEEDLIRFELKTYQRYLKSLHKSFPETQLESLIRSHLAVQVALLALSWGDRAGFCGGRGLLFLLGQEEEGQDAECSLEVPSPL